MPGHGRRTRALACASWQITPWSCSSPTPKPRYETHLQSFYFISNERQILTDSAMSSLDGCFSPLSLSLDQRPPSFSMSVHTVTHNSLSDSILSRAQIAHVLPTDLKPLSWSSHTITHSHAHTTSNLCSAPACYFLWLEDSLSLRSHTTHAHVHYITSSNHSHCL